MAHTLTRAMRYGKPLLSLESPTPPLAREPPSQHHGAHLPHAPPRESPDRPDIQFHVATSPPPRGRVGIVGPNWRRSSSANRRASYRRASYNGMSRSPTLLNRDLRIEARMPTRTPSAIVGGLESLLHTWDGEELILRFDRPTGA